MMNAVSAYHDFGNDTGLVKGLEDENEEASGENNKR